MGVDGQAHHPKWRENPGQCYQVNGYFKFFYLFSVMLGLHCFRDLSLVAASRGH